MSVMVALEENVRGSPKLLGFNVWGPLMSVNIFTAIYTIVVKIQTNQHWCPLSFAACYRVYLFFCIIHASLYLLKYVCPQ